MQTWAVCPQCNDAEREQFDVAGNTVGPRVPQQSASHPRCSPAAARGGRTRRCPRGWPGAPHSPLPRAVFRDRCGTQRLVPRRTLPNVSSSPRLGNVGRRRSSGPSGERHRHSAGDHNRGRPSSSSPDGAAGQWLGHAPAHAREPGRRRRWPSGCQRGPGPGPSSRATQSPREISDTTGRSWRQSGRRGIAERSCLARRLRDPPGRSRR